MCRIHVLRDVLIASCVSEKRCRPIPQLSTFTYLLMYIFVPVSLWQTQVSVCQELVLEKFSFKFTASSVGGGGTDLIQGLLCGVEWKHGCCSVCYCVSFFSVPLHHWCASSESVDVFKFIFNIIDRLKDAFSDLKLSTCSLVTFVLSCQGINCLRSWIFKTDDLPVAREARVIRRTSRSDPKSHYRR